MFRDLEKTLSHLNTPNEIWEKDEQLEQIIRNYLSIAKKFEKYKNFLISFLFYCNKDLLSSNDNNIFYSNYFK